jgi:hypothetical protein
MGGHRLFLQTFEFSAFILRILLSPAGERKTVDYYIRFAINRKALDG